MFDLNEKTVLITGGCGLLGVKHAEAILEFGGEVILADIVSKEEQEKVITSLKQIIFPYSVCATICNV